MNLLPITRTTAKAAESKVQKATKTLVKNPELELAAKQAQEKLNQLKTEQRQQAVAIAKKIATPFTATGRAISAATSQTYNDVKLAYQFNIEKPLAEARVKIAKELETQAHIRQHNKSVRTRAAEATAAKTKEAAATAAKQKAAQTAQKNIENAQKQAAAKVRREQLKNQVQFEINRGITTVKEYSSKKIDQALETTGLKQILDRRQEIKSVKAQAKYISETDKALTREKTLTSLETKKSDLEKSLSEFTAVSKRQAATNKGAETKIANMPKAKDDKKEAFKELSDINDKLASMKKARSKAAQIEARALEARRGELSEQIDKLDRQIQQAIALKESRKTRKEEQKQINSQISGLVAEISMVKTQIEKLQPKKK